MPKVSVIMGVHNCKDILTLEKSVNSIINQTFKEWEFIICDDGSTDDTLIKLKEMEKLDKRIRVIYYKNNKGLAYALNKCIEKSKGKYIARQDDDDVSHINRLEKQYKFMEENSDIDIVGCNANVIDNDNIWGKYLVKKNPTKYDFLWSNPFIHPVMMMKKKSLINAGGYRVSKETRRCEDYDLFMRMYSMNMKGYNIQEVLYDYKIINNNVKYRPIKYRLDEAIVRYKGYKNMGILTKGIPYIIKPLLVSMIPQSIFKYVRKKQY